MLPAILGELLNPFELVASPDILAVPPKYHDYIHPGIRKVYLDLSAYSQAKDRVESLEKRVKSLEKENLNLTEKRARHRVALKHLLEATKVVKDDFERNKNMAEDARLEIDALKATAETATSNAAVLKASLEDMRIKYQAQKEMCRLLKYRYAGKIGPLCSLHIQFTTRRRESSTIDHQPTLNFDSSSPSPASLSQRLSKGSTSGLLSMATSWNTTPFNSFQPDNFAKATPSRRPEISPSSGSNRRRRPSTPPTSLHASPSHVLGRKTRFSTHFKDEDDSALVPDPASQQTHKHRKR